jgi:hypothetical protein
MTERPKFEDAPGHIVRPLKTGWDVRWQARTDLVIRGYHPKNVRIMKVGFEPTDFERRFVAEVCTTMQRDMLHWAHEGELPRREIYDGTLRGLIGAYQTDPVSPYQKVRFASRRNYDALLVALTKALPSDLRIEDIRPRVVHEWHKEWTERGVSQAHGIIAMLRMVVSFGAIYLECEVCQQKRSLLSGMRFPMLPARKEVLTADMAVAIRAAAHKAGHPEIALAQAVQFECTLRQKDVIGEWVPMDEPGMSEVTDDRYQVKWLRGIRWSEIDSNLILRHVTSKRQKEIEVDLKLAPMVMEELELLGERPKSGPLIVNGDTSLPYRTFLFRRHWRKIADAAGIPKAIKNMDTRAGAITEATDSGASIEDVRHAATHSNVAMTQRYSRNAAGKTATVMELRAQTRNKGRT